MLKPGLGGILPAERKQTQAGTFTFTRPISKDGNTYLLLDHTIEGVDWRVIGLDKSGKAVEPRSRKVERPEYAAGHLTHAELQFACPIDQIEQYRVQTSAIEWIEFKDVALPVPAASVPIANSQAIENTATTSAFSDTRPSPNILVADLIAHTTYTLFVPPPSLGYPVKGNHPWPAEAVKAWARQHSPFGDTHPPPVTQKGWSPRDPALEAVLAQGACSVPALQEALVQLAPDHPAVDKIVYALGRIGTRESVPILIQALRRAESSWPDNQAHIAVPIDLDGSKRYVLQTLSDRGQSALVWALWELSGEQASRTAGQWDAWWQTAQKDFVPARERVIPGSAQ